jgi:hypothetical protein
MCTETVCAPFDFVDGVVAGDADGCIDGIELTAISDPNCTVKCGMGWQDASYEDGALVSCAIDAEKGANATSPISCTEIVCNPFDFVDGVVAGDADGCTDGIELTAISNPNCTVKCEPGWRGDDATVTCAIDTDNASATSTSSTTATSPISCVENVCAAFAFDAGIVGGDTDGCTNGIVLGTKTNNNCTVKCGAGYVGADGANDFRVVCAPDAKLNDVAIATTDDAGKSPMQCVATTTSTTITNTVTTATTTTTYRMSTKPGCCRLQKGSGRGPTKHVSDVQPYEFQTKCVDACHHDPTCTAFEYKESSRRCEFFHAGTYTYTSRATKNCRNSVCGSNGFVVG